MRAKVLPDKGRRRQPWRCFAPGRWYPAERDPADPGIVHLRDGDTTAAWPAEAVEIRAVPDDAWHVHAAARLTDILDGQAIEYPARLAECPEGHSRRIPTRFQKPTVDLRCAGCSRTYRLSMPRAPGRGEQAQR